MTVFLFVNASTSSSSLTWGNPPQDLKMMTNTQTSTKLHFNESRCYLQQFWEPGQDLWWTHFQTFLPTIWFGLVGHVAQIQNGRQNRKDPAKWSQNSVNWQQQCDSASMRFDKGLMINVLHYTHSLEQVYSFTYCFFVAERKPTISIACCSLSKSWHRSSSSSILKFCYKKTPSFV